MLEDSFGLWIVELDQGSRWYNYFNYLTRFQISKYLQQSQSAHTFMLYSCAQDFPVPHILFVHPTRTSSLDVVKQQWLALGKPQTLVFPGNTRWTKDILQLDKDLFRLFHSTENLSLGHGEFYG